MFSRIKNFFLGLFMRTKLYNWLMKDVIPYIRFTPYYSLPSNKKFLKWGALANKGYRKLRTGDIILTVDKKKLTTLFIAGATAKDRKVDFVPSHAAICTSKDKSFEIAEMTHSDFTKSTWHDVCYESTRVMILRCKKWDQKYIDGMMSLIPEFESIGYDRMFKMGLESLACSELIYAFDSVWNYATKKRISGSQAVSQINEMEKLPDPRINVDLSPVIGKREYISPLAFLLSEDTEIIWDSNDESNS